MKKIYALLPVVIGTVLSANAQPFEKGDKLLGGSIGFSNTVRSGSNPGYPQKGTSISVSPGFTFFKKPNRAIGFSLQYGYQIYRYDNNDKDISNSIGAGIYKQYWNSLGKNFYFIIDGRLAGNYNKINRKTAAGITVSEQSALNFAVSINPGISYRISKHLVTDMFFSNFLSVFDSYSKIKENYQGLPARDYNTNVVGLSTGFNNFSINDFQFGFRYIL